jgi:hypothetical protein
MECTGIKCPICGCPVTTVLKYAIIAFLVMFAFEWVFHGMYMMPAYEATADLWRPQAEMEELFPYGMLSKFFTAFALGGLYGLAYRTSVHGGKCLKAGLKFGFLAGVVLGMRDFSAYTYMPISMDMALNWLLGGFLTGILVGVALAFASRMCNKGASCA